jgi:D-alanine-D-alanine ligase
VKVAVLHGQVPANAPKDEQDVLVEVEVVSRALARLGHDPVAVPFSLDMAALRLTLEALDPALVFNLVESVEGRGQLIHLAPALLDHLHLPYTGAPTEAMFATSNKLLAKKLLAGAGIATPEWTAGGSGGSVDGPLSGPFIVKSVWEHASIGIDQDSVVSDLRALQPLLERRRDRYGGAWFAEAYIAGREFNISLLASGRDPQVLPPAEIHFVAHPADRLKIVDYRAKWDIDSCEYRNTPRCFEFPDADRELLIRLVGIAQACWRLFGLRGYARVDFRVDDEGKPWVLEVNTNPCLAPDAGFLAAASRASLGIDQVVDRISQDAVAF